MAEEHRFYNVYSYGDKLQHGEKLVIDHTISFRDESADISGLIAKTAEEIAALREASVEKESAIYQKLREATKEWEKQAGNTLLLDKALEYVKTPAITHTANQWVKDEHGGYEISNMVYKMYFRVGEDTRYNHKTKATETVAWDLWWSIHTQSPAAHAQRYHTAAKKIAGQDRKRYPDKAAMEKYMNGRFTAYAHLFAELSPPIPNEYGYLRNFTVNGQLLPGYTVEGQPPPQKEQAPAPVAEGSASGNEFHWDVKRGGKPNRGGDERVR